MYGCLDSHVRPNSQARRIKDLAEDESSELEPQVGSSNRE